MGYESLDVLHDLLASGQEGAFAAALASHARFDAMLVELAPELQARPTAAAAVRAVLPAYHVEHFERWMARRRLSLAALDLAAFATLADAAARRRDPAFPALDLGRLQMTERWYAGSVRTLDDRVDGVGWVVAIEERDVGPAEAIHEEQWRATAHGRGFRVEVGLDYGIYDHTVTWEHEHPG